MKRRGFHSSFTFTPMITEAFSWNVRKSFGWYQRTLPFMLVTVIYLISDIWSNYCCNFIYNSGLWSISSCGRLAMIASPSGLLHVGTSLNASAGPQDFLHLAECPHCVHVRYGMVSLGIVGYSLCRRKQRSRAMALTPRWSLASSVWPGSQSSEG